MRSKLISLLALTLCFSTNANAGTSASGTITKMNVEQGKVFIYHSGAITGAASCSAYGRWVVNAGNANGQAMLSVLLTLYAQGKSIVIYGTGACSDWGDSESIEAIAQQ